MLTNFISKILAAKIARHSVTCFAGMLIGYKWLSTIDPAILQKWVDWVNAGIVLILNLAWMLFSHWRETRKNKGLVTVGVDLGIPEGPTTVQLPAGDIPRPSDEKGASKLLNCWWIVPLLLCLITGSGCVQMLKATDKRIVAIETRGWGLHLAMSENDQVPCMRVGYISQKVSMIPISTNEMYSPAYTSSYGNSWNTFRGHMEEQVSTLKDFKPVPVILDTNSMFGGVPTNFKPYVYNSGTVTNIETISYITNANGSVTVCTNCRVGPIAQ